LIGKNINSHKSKYIEFCESEANIPIFSQYWWLDAVCGEDNWDVIVIEKGGSIVATLPYCFTNKKGAKHISMPLLTQTLGPYIKYPADQKYENKLSFEKEIFTKLIDSLPDFKYFKQNFHYTITNWLPFYWKGFKQTTRYTYVIDDLNDIEKVFSNFNYSKKKNIKKAQTENIEVKFDLPAKEFYENHKLTLNKQNEKITYSFDLFRKIYTEGYSRNAAKVIYATDSSNNIHSALFVIWDKNSAYDLISTIDPEFRNSGSASLLVKEMISFLADKTGKFDFEGSMIENVENSFRKFGAKQIQYFNITKTNSKIFRLKNSLKEIKHTLLNK
jgi:hypothetical protein